MLSHDIFCLQFYSCHMPFLSAIYVYGGCVISSSTFVRYSVKLFSGPEVGWGEDDQMKINLSLE